MPYSIPDSMTVITPILLMSRECHHRLVTRYNTGYSVARNYKEIKTGKYSVMDIIYLTELEIETIIGIYDWERTTKQTVSLDIEMGTDIAKAASSDAIEDTLNYKAVAKRLIEYVAATEFQLIETLSERICEIILNEFSVPWVKLRVSKPGAIRGSRNVGVMIERGSKVQ